MNFKDAEEEETIKDKGIYLRSVFTYSYLCYVTLLKLDLKVLQKQFSFIKSPSQVLSPTNHILRDFCSILHSTLQLY